jgi:hypothetical protein
MADPKTSEVTPESKTPEVKAPPQGGHKHPPQGPTTGRLLSDWRMDRDYENFNPTAEK